MIFKDFETFFLKNHRGDHMVFDYFGQFVKKKHRPRRDHMVVDDFGTVSRRNHRGDHMMF